MEIFYSLKKIKDAIKIIILDKKKVAEGVYYFV